MQEQLVQANAAQTEISAAGAKHSGTGHPRWKWKWKKAWALATCAAVVLGMWWFPGQGFHQWRIEQNSSFNASASDGELHNLGANQCS